MMKTHTQVDFGLSLVPGASGKTGKRVASTLQGLGVLDFKGYAQRTVTSGVWNV